MEISFQNRRLEREFRTARDIQRNYGLRMARTIMVRVDALANADSLAEIPHTPPERLHQLEGERHGQYAIDLVHPSRLVFRIANDPIPLRADGGIDLEQVTAIIITEIVDYH